MFIIPTCLTALLLGSSPDSTPQVMEPTQLPAPATKVALPGTASFGASYGTLLLPTTVFGSGLRSKRMVQGPSDLRTRTLGFHGGLSGDRIGGSLEFLWLRGDGIAPSASVGQFPTHGESLDGFLWGGSLDVFGASTSASIRPVASAGLRYLRLHRRLDHDTLSVGQAPKSPWDPGSSLETSFDQKGFLFDLSAGLRFRLGQATFLDARIGALSGDDLGSESLTRFGLDDSRHLDPYLRFGVHFDGVPAWLKAFGSNLNRSPGSLPALTPL